LPGCNPPEVLEAELAALDAHTQRIEQEMFGVKPADIDVAALPVAQQPALHPQQLRPAQ